MASGLVALRRAPPLLGGRASLRRLGSGPGAQWRPPRRGWRLGAGLGLALAATAVAAAAAGGDAEEKPAAGFARAVGSSRELLRRVKVGGAPEWEARGPRGTCRV